MPEAQYEIYTLVDPRDGAVRYVGLSQDAKYRYHSHCNATNIVSSAYNWLKELKEQGLKPLLFIVEDGLNVNTAWERETYWMVFFLKEGEPLVNRVASKRLKEVKCSN